MATQLYQLRPRAPIGSATFVQHQLQHPNQQHQHLLARIPHLEDLQVSWLLLLYCASTGCTYLLRMCSPNVTTEFANNHDFAVAACLRRPLQVEDLPALALATAHPPLSQGGLGLTCASVLATPAFWSSWADSLPVIQPTPPIRRRDFRATLTPLCICPQYPSISR